MATSHAANAITGLGSSGTATTVARSDHEHNSAYTPLAHASATNNPHNVTAEQVGAEPSNANIQTHINATDNPHGVTCEQIGAADTSHLHDDRYFTETEADERFAPVSHTYHMSPIVAAMIFGGGE